MRGPARRQHATFRRRAQVKFDSQKHDVDGSVGRRTQCSGATATECSARVFFAWNDATGRIQVPGTPSVVVVDLAQPRRTTTPPEKNTKKKKKISSGTSRDRGAQLTHVHARRRLLSNLRPWRISRQRPPAPRNAPRAFQTLMRDPQPEPRVWFAGEP